MRSYNIESEYIKEILLSKEAESAMKSYNDKRLVKSFLKVYAALLNKFSSKHDINGYFEIPSEYLEKFCSRYRRHIELMKDYGLIQIYTSPDGAESYDTVRGECKRYKPLFDFTQGKTVEVILSNRNYDHEWYKITRSSLGQLGIKQYVSRDSFGRRLYSTITGTMDSEFQSYKKFFKSQKDKYVVIDAKCCQPHLLKKLYQEHGLFIDPAYEEALTSDFYLYMLKHFHDLTDDCLSQMSQEELEAARDKMKKQFATWINGEVHQTNCLIGIFPMMTSSLKRLKQKCHKAVGRKLHRFESSIFIDNLLNQIATADIDFCLTVHDSFIVKESDQSKIFDFVSERVDFLKFDSQPLN